MKEVCIINYASRAAIYGIGTYIREYVYCLKNMSCKINLIELGTDNNSAGCYIKEEGNVRTIHIPYMPKGITDRYNKSVCRLLRLYIEDSDNLIFHYHYTQSESLLESIKKYFPLSKSLFTIHYLSWSQFLQGNVLLFEKIIRNQENEKIKKQYQYVIDNYKKEKKILEKFDYVICLSEDTMNLVHNRYQIKQNVWLIPNGIREKDRKLSNKQKQIFRENQYLRQEEKILLFAGRIDPIKGIYCFLSCFDNVLRKYPDCRLVMIGDGNISEAIKKCGKSRSKIIFAGRLDKKIVYQWYQIADIALFPSFYEECSYVGIETMMHGLPVVASDGYSVKNMFHPSVNAMVAKIGNQKKTKEFETNLANTILELLSSERLRKQLSCGARQMYESQYTVLKMQEGYKKLFTSLDNKK